MKKIQKMIIVLIMSAISLFSFAACNFPFFDKYKSDFRDDCVLVTLTTEATKEFLIYDYTPEDFKEVNAVKVYDFMPFSLDWVRKKVQGIPVERELGINIEEYQRGLAIYLPNHNKKEVLKAVEILQQREDIFLASPNWISHIA